MKQEDKELLLKDLCARLPHKVIVEIKSYGQETQKPWIGELSCKDLDCYLHNVAYKSIKPYLRPLSSMTEGEKVDYQAFFNYNGVEYPEEYIDWCNKNHFDYRGLIPIGLALDCTGLNIYD